MRHRGVIFLDVDGVFLHPVGINNPIDHPYLTRDMKLVKETFPDGMYLFDSVNQFSEWMALRVLKEDFRG